MRLNTIECPGGVLAIDLAQVSSLLLWIANAGDNAAAQAQMSALQILDAAHSNGVPITTLARKP